MKLVDIGDSKSPVLADVAVRVRPLVPFLLKEINNRQKSVFLCLKFGVTCLGLCEANLNQSIKIRLQRVSNIWHQIIVSCGYFIC